MWKSLEVTHTSTETNTTYKVSPTETHPETEKAKANGTVNKGILF